MKFISIIVLLTFCSCSGNREHNLIRTWKVRNYTIWEKGIGYLFGVRSFESGHELTLNPDSTFKEKTCGNIIIGKWSHLGDSIILNGDSMWYGNTKWYRENKNRGYDSIAGIGADSRRTFLILKNKLIKIHTGKRYHIQKDGSEQLADGYLMTILK